MYHLTKSDLAFALDVLERKEKFLQPVLAAPAAPVGR